MAQHDSASRRGSQTTTMFAHKAGDGGLFVSFDVDYARLDGNNLVERVEADVFQEPFGTYYEEALTPEGRREGQQDPTPVGFIQFRERPLELERIVYFPPFDREATDFPHMMALIRGADQGDTLLLNGLLEVTVLDGQADRALQVAGVDDDGRPTKDRFTIHRDGGPEVTTTGRDVGNFAVNDLRLVATASRPGPVVPQTVDPETLHRYSEGPLD